LTRHRTWSVDCAGVLSAGVPFDAEFSFYVVPDGSVITTFTPVTNTFDEKRSITGAQVPAGAVQIPIPVLRIGERYANARLRAKP
jgi:hypothetical protein